MTKAEEAALKAYPHLEQPVFDEMYPRLLFTRNTERSAFIKGYERAEKDLILTWRDIKTIVEIADKLVEKDVNGQLPEVCETEEGYYMAILEEFNKTRK